MWLFFLFQCKFFKVKISLFLWYSLYCVVNKWAKIMKMQIQTGGDTNTIVYAEYAIWSNETIIIIY